MQFSSRRNVSKSTITNGFHYAGFLNENEVGLRRWGTIKWIVFVGSDMWITHRWPIDLWSLPESKTVTRRWFWSFKTCKFLSEMLNYIWKNEPVGHVVKTGKFNGNGKTQSKLTLFEFCIHTHNFVFAYLMFILCYYHK